MQTSQYSTIQQSAAINARALALAAQRSAVISHYTPHQQTAAMLLYTVAERHLGTSGGNAAAKLLLGLYNGTRFPFDLTDLRIFDPENLAAAFVVLEMDASRCWCEIHILLDAIRGTNANTGAEFEHWAYRLSLKGRCKKDQLPTLPSGPQQ